MGCGCGKKKAVTVAALMEGEGLSEQQVQQRNVVQNQPELRIQDMISSLRAEELLKMPFYPVLEPAIIRVGSSDIATRILSSLAESDVYIFEDVLNLTDEEFLSIATCGQECLEVLKSAIKSLGF